MSKPLNYKEPAALMSLEEATTYLKKIGEWESVVNMDRDTIILWADFLKKRESKTASAKPTTQRTLKS